MNSFEDLNQLDAFAEAIINALPRAQVLSRLAYGFGSFTQGFANALDQYVRLRRIPTKLRQADDLLTFADTIIPTRQHVLCSECNCYAPAEHICVWKCGLCGLEHYTRNSHQSHVWKCAENNRFMTDRLGEPVGRYNRP